MRTQAMMIVAGGLQSLIGRLHTVTAMRTATAVIGVTS